LNTVKNILIKIGKIDRRVIFLIVAMAILIPMLAVKYEVGDDYFRIPIYASQTSKDFFNAIEKLDDDSNILVTFEYGPATAAEIQPMVTSLLKHSFYKNHKLYLLALWPDGKMMSEEAIAEVKSSEILVTKEYVITPSVNADVLISSFDFKGIEELSITYVSDSFEYQKWDTISSSSSKIKQAFVNETLLKGEHDFGLINVQNEFENLDSLINNIQNYLKINEQDSLTIEVSKWMEFQDYYPIIDYENYINLGYKPGGEAVIKGITKNLTEKFKTDLNGGKTDELEIMQRVKDPSGIIKLSEFDLIASFSAGSVGTEEWILYASDPEKIPIISGVTSVQVTDLIPYVRSGQLGAILDGLPAAAEYESLVDDALKNNGTELRLHGKGTGQESMIPQSIVHLLIVLFIIFGNISYFLEKRRKK